MLAKKKKKIFGIILLVLSGSILAFSQTFSVDTRQLLFMAAAALSGAVCCELAWNYVQGENLAWMLTAAPWVLILALTRFHGYLNGMKAWINGILYRFNTLQDKAVPLFGGNMTVQDEEAFGLLAALLIGQLIWWLVSEGHVVVVWLSGVAGIVLMLLGGTFSTLPCALIISGILGMCMAGKQMELAGTAHVWIVLITVCTVAAALLIPVGDLASVADVRRMAGERVRDARYGEEELPEGDLTGVAAFGQGTDGMLRVRAEQKKALYLKAYVGSVYQNGSWETMPESTYGGDNAGMLKWLAEKGFDPLTQSATYNRLSDGTDLEENQVQIEVQGASRYYFYAPETLSGITEGKGKEQKDEMLRTAGFLGEKNYSFTELSGSRPAELMVAEDWLQNPVTAEQEAYCEAEAVYRQFVYDHYTAVDEALYKTVEDIFWNDYDETGDGIYRALIQIRTKLKEAYWYTDSPITGTGADPLADFLEETHSGNAMLYASAAVEAFRVHGIPARYVEGYYLPAEAFGSSEDGTVLLSGKDMHAWAEVYFDGIGWLPVDVTPGYYYEVTSLQKLVSAPDQVQKNAALKDNSFGGNPVSNLEGTTEERKTGEGTVQAEWREAGMVLLGILAFLLICGTVLLLLFELAEIIYKRKLFGILEHGSAEERIAVLEEELYLILEKLGIEVRLGWNTKETDDCLRTRFPGIEAGSYIRVCGLLEKLRYGGEPLEPYEERVVKSFLEKLLQETGRCDLKMRIAIRYRHCTNSVGICQIKNV